MNKDGLEQLSIKEYFEYFNTILRKNIELEFLTNIFTELAYNESKPYLTRRAMIPRDNRFSKIELVYDESNSNKVGAIVWQLEITLRELVNIFGKPLYNYMPYNDSVEFAFISSNPDLVIIKTRLPFSKVNNNNFNKLKSINDLSLDDSLFDLLLSFLQFNIE